MRVPVFGNSHGQGRASTSARKTAKYTKTLVLTNLLVFSAVGLFWLTLPSGITSLDRLTTYIPPGESVGFLDGVVVGRAGLVRDEERWRKDAKAEKREYP